MKTDVIFYSAIVGHIVGFVSILFFYYRTLCSYEYNDACPDAHNLSSVGTCFVNFSMLKNHWVDLLKHTFRDPTLECLYTREVLMVNCILTYSQVMLLLLVYDTHN